MSSGNSLDYSKEDWDQLHANEAAVKEMEAAGISWVAHLHGVPFLAIKSITDIVDGDRPPQEEFLENLHAAAQALQACLPLSTLLQSMISSHVNDVCLCISLQCSPSFHSLKLALFCL